MASNARTTGKKKDYAWTVGVPNYASFPVLELVRTNHIARIVGGAHYVGKIVQMQERSNLVASFVLALRCVGINVPTQAS